MKDMKKKSIDMLSKFGRFGLGKTITLGMYDFEIPAQLMRGMNLDNKNTDKRK